MPRVGEDDDDDEQAVVDGDQEKGRKEFPLPSSVEERTNGEGNEAGNRFSMRSAHKKKKNSRSRDFFLLVGAKIRW